MKEENAPFLSGVANIFVLPQGHTVGDKKARDRCIGLAMHQVALDLLSIISTGYSVLGQSG